MSGRDCSTLKRSSAVFSRGARRRGSTRRMWRRKRCARGSVGVAGEAVAGPCSKAPRADAVGAGPGGRVRREKPLMLVAPGGWRGWGGRALWSHAGGAGEARVAHGSLRVKQVELVVLTEPGLRGG
eukprot:gene11348-biopygen6824